VGIDHLRALVGAVFVLIFAFSAWPVTKEVQMLGPTRRAAQLRRPSRHDRRAVGTGSTALRRSRNQRAGSSGTRRSPRWTGSATHIRCVHHGREGAGRDSPGASPVGATSATELRRPAGTPIPRMPRGRSATGTGRAGPTRSARPRGCRQSCRCVRTASNTRSETRRGRRSGAPGGVLISCPARTGQERSEVATGGCKVMLGRRDRRGVPPLQCT